MLSARTCLSNKCRGFFVLLDIALTLIVAAVSFAIDLDQMTSAQNCYQLTCILFFKFPSFVIDVHAFGVIFRVCACVVAGFLCHCLLDVMHHLNACSLMFFFPSPFAPRMHTRCRPACLPACLPGGVFSASFTSRRTSGACFCSR